MKMHHPPLPSVCANLKFTSTELTESAHLLQFTATIIMQSVKKSITIAEKLMCMSLVQQTALLLGKDIYTVVIANST